MSSSATNAYKCKWIHLLGCNVGNQVVSRCHTIGGIYCEQKESDEIHPGFEIPNRRHQKSKRVTPQNALKNGKKCSCLEFDMSKRNTNTYKKKAMWILNMICQNSDSIVRPLQTCNGSLQIPKGVIMVPAVYAIASSLRISVRSHRCIFLLNIHWYKKDVFEIIYCECYMYTWENNRNATFLRLQLLLKLITHSAHCVVYIAVSEKVHIWCRTVGTIYAHE